MKMTWFLAVLGLWAAAAQAQGQVPAQGEPAIVKRAVELREAPGDASRSLGPLAAETPVARLGVRQGAWTQVRTAQGTTGWLHMFDLGSSGSAAAAAPSSSSNPLRGLTSLFGRAPQQAHTQSTSTVGIRGLEAADIANAQPNLNAVAQAEAQRQNEAQAREFAASAALNAYQVPPLPEPPRPSSNAGGAPAGNPQAQ